MDVASIQWRRLRKQLLALLIVGGIIAAAQVVRRQAGIEWSTDSIRQAVGGFGLLAPVGYILLVVFRQAMALPSVVVLTSAGLLFGMPLGTLLGGLGITLNGLALFVAARLLGRDWVLPRIHSRFPDFEQRATTAGPLLIAFMTGHPMGIITPFHLAAGITGISWTSFLLAVGPASLFRAGCYSFLGANLLEPGSPGLWIASGVLVVAALAPLAHAGLRARILKRTVLPEKPAEDSDTASSR